MKTSFEPLIGIDLVDIDRFRNLITKYPGLLARVFNERELKGLTPEKHADKLAARFAGKEAVMKVLETPIFSVSFRDISILGGIKKRPYVNLSGRALEHAKLRNIEVSSISLTHSASVAVAAVVAKKFF